MYLTRLAPSPTGALHLGNVRTFLINWVLARRNGWQIALRIDDLDGPRIKSKAAEQAIEDLAWLGLDWDEGPVRQTEFADTYRERLQELAQRGLIYACSCTRKEIEANPLSAPHADEHELRYPGTCRPSISKPTDYVVDDSLPQNWRVRVDDTDIEFADEFCGGQSFNVQQQVGDFVVATKQGSPSYQLAVVIDDDLQGVTEVVRGDDLLSSTPRQLLLKEHLGITTTTRYWHLPLVVGPDGRRLAKRHGDSRIASYRERGATRERVLGLMWEWCGLGPRKEVTLDEFVNGFDLARLSKEPTVMTAHDHKWIGAGE